jgi:tetratricopeptide (TPR) repeat protein
VQHYLSQESAGQWLLVLDNADDLDMWTKKTDSNTKSTLLIDSLPRSNQGSIVFTTRSRKAASKFAQSNVVHVAAMDEETATGVLRNSLFNKEVLNDGPSVAELLILLACLPLAIVQAAAYINENDISLADYVSLFDDREENVIEVLSEEFEDEGRYRDLKNPIATTWLISFEQIRVRDPLAADYLSFMSCIDAKAIPLSLLPPAQSKKKEIDAIGTLSAYSFITKRPADQSFDLHRLVHLATRNWLREQNLLSEWTAKTLARLVKVFPNNNHENRAVWRSYLPHAHYVQSSEAFQSSPEENVDWIELYGLCLFSDGRWKEAETAIMQVVETRKKLLGEEHPGTLHRIAILAATYRNQGRWKEAEELGVKVMNTSLRVLGEEHPDTLRRIANLASTYWNQGRWKEAEELDGKVMNTSLRVLGDEHPDTLARIANLAATYQHQGRWKEAEELEVKVMKASLRVLGEEHPDTLSRIANLASTYRNQGRWKEAEELEVKVMNTSLRMLGEEHPDTLHCIANLAATYQNQGRWKEAEELEVKVMKASLRVLGEEHPDTLRRIANLASTYWNQGRWKEAEELGVQAMDARKRVLGKEHPNTLDSMANVALTWKSQGRNVEAILLMERCIELRNKVIGPHHPGNEFSLRHLNQWRMEALEI